MKVIEHDQITIRENDGAYTVIELDGQFVGGDETDALQEVLFDAANNEAKVLIDMSGVSFANSSFLSALLSAHARLTRAGGVIVVAGLSPTVAQVFTITKLDLIFNVFDTATQAIEFINKND